MARVRDEVVKPIPAVETRHERHMSFSRQGELAPARRLDPTVPTSAEYTLLLLGDPDGLKAMHTGGEFEAVGAYLPMYQGRLAEVRVTVEHLMVDPLSAHVSLGDRGAPGERPGPGSRFRSDG